MRQRRDTWDKELPGQPLWTRILREHTKVALSAMFALALALSLWPLFRLSNRVLETASLDGAERYAEVMEEHRTLYASEVVARLQNTDISITHDYLKAPHSIPLPATLSILLGERIAQRGQGGKTLLYSPFPFPGRQTESGLRDNFAKDAWSFLSDNPEKAYFRFEHSERGQILRYAKADIMREDCVRCHNEHPNSPKSDWRLGDVRGVMEIRIPLENVVSKSQYDVRFTFALTTLITASIFFVLALVIGRLRNITVAFEEANRRLEELSTTDGMTSLANFRHLDQEFRKEHQRAARFNTSYSLIFLDVDHFKNYNDNNGHQAGDLVLSAIGELLARNVRETDLPARYGGEEFVILCPSIDATNAAAFAERIRKAVQNTNFVGAKKQPLGCLTVSIGVASYPLHARSREGVLRMADHALYESKRKGRNRVTVAQEKRDLENHTLDLQPT